MSTPISPTHSLVCLALLLISVSCGDEKPVSRTKGDKGPLIVYTVNEPLRYFVDRIGGKGVRAVFPMKEAGDPAFWEPSTEVLLDYQKADLIVRNGAEYARWMARASLPASRIVDSSRAFADHIIEIKNSVTHQHGPAGKHSHSGHAFTTWLDPKLAVQQALAVKEALSARLPEDAKGIEERFVALRRDLEDLDQQIAGIVAKKPDLPLLGSHPVYQYLGKRYSLSLVSVHWEPEEIPAEADWTQLEKILADHEATAMLWEAEPRAEVRSRLEKLGVRCLVYDPCASTPKQGDFLTRMRENVANLGKAWQ